MQRLTPEQAVILLRANGILIYPTESFWAIGCLANRDIPVRAICGIKRRPPGKPLPLIAANTGQAEKYLDLSYAPPDLVARYWPGPLTLVLPIKNYLASDAINQQHKAAARVSACAIARQLALDAPIVATSANLSGQAPVSTSDCLDENFLNRICAYGLPFGMVMSESDSSRQKLPSTLVEPFPQDGGWRLRILREGQISRESLTCPDWDIL